jgi:hypothetical protein
MRYDIEMDCATAEDGSGWSCGQLFEEPEMNAKAKTCGYDALKPINQTRNMSISRTDPFTFMANVLANGNAI